jgi:glycosyltransferase involved in cell wall biosynthesis
MNLRALSPIALFVYNRPCHVRQTIDALLQNDQAAQSELIIFSDGPKTQEASGKVEEVRQYIKTIKGFRRIHIRERKENRGLANSIIDGVTDIVNEYGRVIVLEDDLLTSPYFLKYMNEGLDFYKQDHRVISVLGYVYPVKTSLPETFFIKGAYCWGWATWKRGWDLFEKDGAVLLKKLQDRKLTGEFDCNGAYPYTEMLKKQIIGKNDSWGVRWNASAFLNNKLTLFPGTSLVRNIGNEGSGIHCGTDHVMDVKLAQAPINVNEIEVVEHSSVSKTFEDFFCAMKKSPVTRLRKQMGEVIKRYIGKHAGV